MEYIAILIAFLLGAYVRQPIIWHREPKQTPKAKEVAKKLEDEQLTMQEQYANIMKFNGKEQVR